MNNLIVLDNKKSEIFKSVIIDVFGIAAMYFMPAAAHMLSLPLYLLEPIRLIIILAIVHTNRYNAFILAWTLPLFSFLVSGHPVLFKMMVISAEVSLNVFLFYLGLKIIKNKFLSMAVAIILSKLFYYALEYIMLQAALIPSGLGEHPLLIQIGIVAVLSFYVLIFFRDDTELNPRV